MSVTAGIVGLPNVGKSTIFNALCAARAPTENYPFCTIEPNHGVVAIPDPRLGRITAVLPSAKVVPAFLELEDIAGLVRNASKGEGLGNQFLGHIKNVDAIAHVVRCFEDPQVSHVESGVDPVRDVGIVSTELLLKDLETLERAVSRLQHAVKTGDKESAKTLAVCERVRDGVAAGEPVRRLVKTPEEKAAVRDLHLLTAKPVLYVANIDERAIGSANPAAEALERLAAEEGTGCIRMCGKLEAEIAQLEPKDRREFLLSAGLSESALDILSRELYRLLGLQTFFTVSPVQNTAWTIPVGATAVEAAGVVHTDFAAHFVRAEVYTVEDLEIYRSEAALRAAGRIRSEGRDYVVQDGDIMYFRTTA